MQPRSHAYARVHALQSGNAEATPTVYDDAVYSCEVKIIVVRWCARQPGFCHVSLRILYASLLLTRESCQLVSVGSGISADSEISLQLGRVVGPVSVFEPITASSD